MKRKSFYIVIAIVMLLATIVIPNATWAVDLKDFVINTAFDPNGLIMPGQKINVTVSVTTSTGCEIYYGTKDVLLIVALYNEKNTMTHVRYITKGIPFKSAETLTVELQLPDQLNGCKIRTYLWDGTDVISDMIPLSKPEERTAPPIRYIKEGANFIYSNNPETIEVPQMSTVGEAGRYITENTVLKNQTYDVEYFHLNKTGQTLKIGIVIKNDTGKNQKLHVLNRGVIDERKDSTPKGTIDYGADVVYEYVSVDRSKEPWVEVPDGSSIFLLATDVPDKHMGIGKIKFIPTADMKLRVFYAYNSPELNAESIFQLTQRSQMRSNMTTGTFLNDTRRTTIDAKLTPSFYLASNSSNNTNQDEFERPVNNSNDPNSSYYGCNTYIGTGIHLGNYGITYDIQLANAGGKRLKITPYSFGKNQPASFLLWTKATGWYITDKRCYPGDSNNKDPYYIDVPADQHFKFILTGNNFGNIKFDVVN